ncbi:MAG TPA: exodeoxyribonuclease VII large subunit [Acidimicrobiales bacterium]|nr:exodeoxyribonuclease VII large subunit [Acidimicrobiales bacterium]
MTLFPEPASVRRLSLVRLSSELARSAAGLGRVSVEGEVVRPRTLPSGRTWFTLRDRAAQISVTVPGGRAARARVVHGERVAVTASVSYSPERGQLFLAAEEVVPVGAGAIAAHLADVRARLAAAGLLDRPRRPLPALPAAVGVVCGADAAVRGDIESVVADRFPGYPVRFAEVSVSGPMAADSIASALRALQGDPDVEVVILARGGGDAAQLLPFSDEELCRAIGAARVPVVTAIGHEGDRPLCDEVADLRFPTPSLAAAAVIPDRRGLQARLEDLAARAGSAVDAASVAARQRVAAADPSAALDAALVLARGRMDAAGRRLLMADPGRRVTDAARLLARIDRQSGMTHRLRRARAQLADRGRTLHALDPARVLQRGYAVVRSGGAVVRSAQQVTAGDPLEVELAEGRLDAVVRGQA